MALSTNAKRILASLVIGTIFTFGYLTAIAIYVVIFYGDDPRYGMGLAPLWPLEVPQRLYISFGGNLSGNHRLASWIVTMTNIPLYGAVAYALIRLIERFRNEKPPAPPINEPPPPPNFN